MSQVKVRGEKMIFSDVVVVIMLYSFVYIAYLATLRHPRNWYTIPSGEKALVTLLLILNILFCSVSATVFDYVALLVSSIFLIFMFLIIGAPAFAMVPKSSTLWEFLALYSDRLVLGLIPIVGITSYWLSNTKLHALFGTAIFIELLWILRLHLANRNRNQQLLNTHSLSVLQTQAADRLEDFIGKHKIDELIRVDNELYWSGCSKTSPPCPVNYYVNKLGLNTPSCCLEHMKELCHTVDQVLTDLEIPHWIDGGTLLGAVREKGSFLAWEDDVDVSFMLDESANWGRFVSELRSILHQCGHKVTTSNKNRTIFVYYSAPTYWLGGLEHYRYRGEIRIDLVCFQLSESFGEKVLERHSSKGAMEQTENRRYGVPVEMLLPTETIELQGKMVSCPKDPDTYLRVIYGNYTNVEYTYVDNHAALSRKNIDEVGRA